MKKSLRKNFLNKEQCGYNKGAVVKIPCKNCLVLPICKSKVNENFECSSWVILYYRCDLFRDYYNFFVSKHRIFEVENYLRSFYGYRYIESLVEKYSEEDDG